MAHVLVRPANMPEFTTSLEQLRSDVQTGRAPPQVIVSLDGGANWLPAWSALGLAPPASSTDEAAKYLIPVGRSGWAIVTGYLSLITMFIVFASVFMLVVAIDSPAKAASMLPAMAVLSVIGIPAQLATASLAHRAIKRDPKLLGMGRVIYTYVCTGLLALLAVGILMVHLVAG